MLIDLPKDITAAETEYEPRPAAGPRPSVPPKEERLQMTLNRLQSCEKPLIYFGGGIISSGAEAELLALAEAQDIPVCSSMMGLGGFPPDHRLWLGMVGMHGTLAANRAARECDLLLACGARFSDRVAGSTTGFAPNAQVVHIDIDHAEFDKNVSVAVRLAGDLRDVLGILSRRADKRVHPAWVGRVTALKREIPASTAMPDAPADPLEVLRTLRRLLPDDAVVATDVGQHQMWTASISSSGSPGHC